MVTGVEVPSGAFALLGKIVPEGVKAYFRRRKIADEELAELRKSLAALLALIDDASVEAQMAVRGSPNEEPAQKSYAEAVRKATAAGQTFASLCGLHAISHNLPARLIDARHRFREVITDEMNLDLVDPVQRAQQCTSIEAAAAHFHQGVRDYAFSAWGLGIAGKSGRLKGRRSPK